MLARAVGLDAGMLPIALPIALGIGLDPSFRAPMAIVVICGLVACTFLSLLVTPVLFSCVDDAMQKMRGLVHKPAESSRQAGLRSLPRIGVSRGC